MDNLEIWEFVKKNIVKKLNTAILCVVNCHGSSPGRKGFKMVLNENGEFCGSIGGGIMEYNLIEKLKIDLKSSENSNYIIKQIHRENGGQEKSGMICSGEETIAIHFFKNKDLNIVESIINAIKNDLSFILSLSNIGLKTDQDSFKNKEFGLTYSNKENWVYTENISKQNTVYIVGGGHVGLGLSKVLSLLDFNVTIIDNRNKLNTLEQNNFVNTKIISPYQDISKHIPEGNNSYVVIMTFGYKDDEIALKSIINNKYRYVGMMGSKAKIKTLLNSLKNEGFSKEKINKIHTPIGVQIKSKTPNEIGISVAAELIKIKNG